MITHQLSKRIVSYFITFIILFIGLNSFSQSKESLQKKQEDLKAEIALTNQLLKKNSENKKATANQLSLISKKIDSRTKLITTIKTNIVYLEDNIKTNTSEIDSLTKEVAVLKKEYAEMVYYAYKTKSSYSKLMYVFSASSFNQAYKRLKYIQQFSEFRQAQVRAIEQIQNNIANKNNQLKESVIHKSKLLGTEEIEKKKIENDKQEKEKVVKQLSQDEKKLKEDLKKKTQAQARLNAEIKRIIAAELKKAREEAERRAREEAARRAREEAARREAAAKNNKPIEPIEAPVEKVNLYEFAVTPAEIKLSDDFAANRGKFQWPVEKGVITQTFGQHQHPVLTKVYTDNDGVDIGTTEGMNARAIFNGEVSAVIIIPGAGKAVLVRHGEYLTVYSNLSEVFVKMGDKVSTKQAVGRILTDKEEGKTELKFQIWKGTLKLNPSYWLLKG